MANDIFSDYIKKQKDKTPLVCANVDSAKVPMDETINILKEISSKLDVLNNQQFSSGNLSMADKPEVKLDESEAFQKLSAPIEDSMVDIAIENGNIVLPDNGIFNMNIYIKNGKIHSLGDNREIKAKRRINASGKYVVPGIIDPHVHLGLFAPLDDELKSETKSALIGGVTTIGCYLGSEGSHFQTVPKISEEVDKNSFVDIFPHLVISTDGQRKEIPDYIEHLGVTSFKVYMNGIPGLIPDVDDGFILDVFSEIKKSQKKCIVCCHAENRDLVRRAYNLVKVEKGDKATIQDWTDTHPDMAEEEAVIRLSFLAEKSKVQVYFVHISSKEAIDRLRKIKQTNNYINIETTSPYLSITRSCTNEKYIKMDPPFRDIEDVEELWNAVSEGVVDTIGTDNVTMTRNEKRMDDDIWNTISGFPAIGTHLPVLLNEGVVKRGIPLEMLIGKITKKPAEIFGIYPKKGTLLPGSDADVVILDMNMVKEIKAADTNSRSDFSLYEGKKIKGWPVTTVKNGEVVVENGNYIGNQSNGKFIMRK